MMPLGKNRVLPNVLSMIKVATRTLDVNKTKGGWDRKTSQSQLV